MKNSISPPLQSLQLRPLFTRSFSQGWLAANLQWSERNLHKLLYLATDRTIFKLNAIVQTATVTFNLKHWHSR